MKLNFNHLYYFYVVAKEGSIKGAAEKLHVSQPTISDQIKLLEEFFQCLLFERRNRSLFLTKEGRLAFLYSEKIFDQANELASKLKNKSLLPKSSVDIGVTHQMSHYFLYDKIMPLFQKERLTVSIREGQRHHLVADLEEDRLDVVFTDNLNVIGSHIKSYRFGVNKTFAVAHKKFHKLCAKFPECLDNIPFLNYTNDSFFKYEIELFFVKHNLAPTILGEADDIDLMYKVAENAIGFTIVPEVAAKRFILNKDIVILGEIKDLETSVWALVKNHYDGPILEMLNNQR